MPVLLDTNILLRLVQPHAPQTIAVEEAIDRLQSGGERLCIVSQNCFEFWAVVTRPSHENGLGFSIEEARNEIDRLRQFFTLLPELPIQNEWEQLVLAYRVVGKASHDARLVAAMRVHGIQRILTLNVRDFRRYKGLTIIDPLDPGSFSEG